MSRTVFQTASGRLESLWLFLRAVVGDLAYETYADRARRSSQPVMTREEFYLDSLRRRYSRVSRCC